jgi:DNA-binding CsgD family transcriptional regulator/NADH:ubiquinone oxidoreductase subunit 6 (subunit J)
LNNGRVLPRRIIAGVTVAVLLGILLATAALSADPGLWKLVLIAVAVGLPGALYATVHPRNVVGWILLADGLVFACMSLANQWLDAGHDSAWAMLIADRVGAVVVPLTLLTLLLVPDGQLPSPRWRAVAAVVVAAQLVLIAVWILITGTPTAPNPIGVLPAEWTPVVDAIGDWLLQVPFILALAALTVRIRRPGERARLGALLGGVVGFAVLAVAGRSFWPDAADALDALGAIVLGAGITVTLLRVPERHEADWSGVETPELTPREREVLELVAEGLTNKEIAERLVISPVTARNHVSRILTKLGLGNRTQAATWLSRRRGPAQDSLAG